MPVVLAIYCTALGWGLLGLVAYVVAEWLVRR